MRYVMFLMIAGCSYTPTHELETQLMTCFNDHARGCELIEAELERRDEANKRRVKRKECPHGAICYYPDEAWWRW